jgi:hypothetical protein
VIQDAGEDRAEEEDAAVDTAVEEPDDTVSRDEDEAEVEETGV